jgi:microcystin-dependent protein
MPSTGTPIGAVTSFGGNVASPAIATALRNEGWLPCDGKSYAQADYPDLHAVILSAHGGDATNFNVPNLRGRWTRGTNHAAGTGSSTVDPDTLTRTAAAAGGAVGNAVGSLQTGATALPKTPWAVPTAGAHTHSMAHLSDTMHEAWSGSWISFARWNQTETLSAAGVHSHTITGGDTATAPINVTLNWIIKAKNV